MERRACWVLPWWLVSGHCAPAPSPPPLSPNGRQDSLSPVVMVTAGLVNERLSDRRGRAGARARPARCGSLALRVPAAGRSAPRLEVGGVGAGPASGYGIGRWLSCWAYSSHGQWNAVWKRKTGTARTLSSLGARRRAR